MWLMLLLVSFGQKTGGGTGKVDLDGIPTEDSVLSRGIPESSDVFYESEEVRVWLSLTV